MVRQAQVHHRLLREVLTNEPVPLLDSDADNKVVDADAALQALGGDHVGFGHLTATVTVWDEDRAQWSRTGCAPSSG